METRDRVNQSRPYELMPAFLTMNSILNPLYSTDIDKVTKYVKHTVTDKPDCRPSVGAYHALLLPQSFMTGSANRSLTRRGKREQYDCPNVVYIVRCLPRRDFPTPQRPQIACVACSCTGPLKFACCDATRISLPHSLTTTQSAASLGTHSFPKSRLHSNMIRFWP